MSREPVVAIVGRPNVGKSSLFNRLVGRRVSIEEPTEGVTRDRIVCPAKVGRRHISLVDTGGIGVVDRQSLEDDVEEQIAFALGSADLIVFVVDGRDRPAELDRRVAAILHRTGLPVVLVANKVDNDNMEGEAQVAVALGFGEPVTVSVLHGRGFQTLTRRLLDRLPADREGDATEAPEVRLALAGRRNVGKSSLVNLLCGHKRVIVSAEPGTTRDAVDVDIERGGKRYTLVDTAGLRKKSQMEDGIEFYSVSRTFGALIRADLVLFLMDAVQGVSNVDQKLADWIQEHHKPCLLVVNKWDLAGNTDEATYLTYVRTRLPGLAFSPVAFISVKEKKGVGAMFKLLEEVLRQRREPLPTPRLNQILAAAQERRAPKEEHGVSPRLNYVTALPGAAPTLLIFGKGTHLLRDDYKRFLAGFFRERLGLVHLPLRFVFREKERRERPGRGDGESKAAGSAGPKRRRP